VYLHLLCSRVFCLTCSHPYLLGSAPLSGRGVKREDGAHWSFYGEIGNRESLMNGICEYCYLPFLFCPVLCLSYFLMLTCTCSIFSPPNCLIPLILLSSMTHMQQVGNLMCKSSDFDFDFSTQFFYSLVSSILRGGWLIRIAIHMFLFALVVNSGCSCFTSDVFDACSTRG